MVKLIDGFIDPVQNGTSEISGEAKSVKLGYSPNIFSSLEAMERIVIRCVDVLTKISK